MNAMLIDKHTLHFEVCLLAVLLILKLNKCVLKAVAGTFVANNLT